MLLICCHSNYVLIVAMVFLHLTFYKETQSIKTEEKSAGSFDLFLNVEVIHPLTQQEQQKM